MTIDANEYLSMKNKVAKVRQEADRAEGALIERLKELKVEFGVDSVEDGETLLSPMEKKLDDLEAAYNEKLSEYKQTWGKQLEEED